ncbi:hypothetical protein [Pedobacter nyackensis]|uniref:hypothetical protein n=1 Tax=Pedobacter nyackensis TaxID=475255 RepID=UPI00292F24DB|nr:hypothetical protein [Pedobacter nyackensis]
MKTSLNELQLIEGFLLVNTSAEDKVLMQARQILQPDLKGSIYWQQKTYQIIETYGREQLRKEIRQVDQKLFTAPEHFSFSKRVKRFFSK